MLTFTDQVNLCKEYSGLSDSTTVITFKRDINAGTARFLAKLSRPVTRQSRTTNLVAAQQYYQLPEDAIRINKIKVPDSTSGSNVRSLIEIADEDTWINVNSMQQSGIPTHYFIKGYDEVGLYPIPSQSITDGLEIVYEPKHVLLTADDYTTGTLSVTNGSQIITGTGTTFTATMANGMYILQILDGTDGNNYKVTSYSNATTLAIENYYQGSTSGSATYRIGQVSRIPEEYQEAPVDYAMFRHYLGKEPKKSLLHKELWETSLKDAEDTYGMSTGNQIIMANGTSRTFNPLLDITTNQINT